MATMKQLSRQEYTGGTTREDIQLGAIQRIADATEKMAQRHTDLIDERDRLKRSVEYWRGVAESRDLRIRALKGQITKLRNKQRTNNRSED